MADRFVHFDVILKRVTDAAILVEYDGDEIWIPVRLVEEYDYVWNDLVDKEIEITIPTWLAKDKGMI
jgi:hypothetical protein